MTETTTQDRTDTAAEDLLGAAARAAEEAESASLAVIRPEQQRFDDNQKAILRQLGVEDATQGDLDLFFHVCRTTGLDPFRRQIYMIGRNTKVTEWVEDDRAQNGRRRVEKWVTKYTIQTGIDGYRRNGREAAKRLGDDLGFDGPWFTGENDFHITDDGEVIQHWRKVWPSKTPPHAARFVVYRNGESFEGIAHYDEFVQTGAGGEPNSMWRKMPRNQIGKCAEALAYRRAYPDDFSGLILDDAAQPTVIDQDGNVESGPAAAAEKRRPAGGSGINAVRAERERRQRQRQADVIDGEVISEEPASDSGAKPEPEQVEDLAPAEAGPEPAKTEKSGMRRAVEKRTFGLIGKITPEPSRDDRLDIYRAIIGRTDISSTDDLDNVEVSKVGDQLYQWQQDGELDAKVRDILMAADERAAAAAAKPEGSEQ